jgi:hypothetical protein
MNNNKTLDKTFYIHLFRMYKITIILEGGNKSYYECNEIFKNGI